MLPFRLIFSLLLCGHFAASAAIAREEIPAETRKYGYSANLAACDDAGVLNAIRSRFSRTERNYWASDIEILGFAKIRQVSFRPNGLDLIPRRYCQAMVILSDRHETSIHYAIIEGAGHIAAFDDVQFCVTGYDRNFTAQGACRRLDR